VATALRAGPGRGHQVSSTRGAPDLRKDWPAVTAADTEPWSSGTVEGHANRIMIKRQMYG
jgi:transposase